MQSSRVDQGRHTTYGWRLPPIKHNTKVTFEQCSPVYHTAAPMAATDFILLEDFPHPSLAQSCGNNYRSRPLVGNSAQRSVRSVIGRFVRRRRRYLKGKSA